MNAVRRAARLAAVLLVLFPSCSPNPPVSPVRPADGLVRIAESIRTKGLVEEGAYDFLRALCDLGPRLTGSEGAANAVAWSQATLDSQGFETWLEPVMVQKWVRGQAEAELSFAGRAGRIPLAAAALGMSIPTPPSGLTAPVLEVRSFDDLDKAGSRVRGRIVFFNAAMESDRGAGTPLGFLVGGDAFPAGKLAAFEALLRPSGILWVRRGGAGGADIGPLAAGGTVMMSFLPDVQRYFDFHHSALDTLNSVHPRELELGAIAMAVMAAAVAEKGI